MFDKKFVERFWKKVEKKSDNECWNWTACCYGKTSNKRGIISVYGKGSLASVMAYCLYTNSSYDLIETVVHRCGNGICCNPAHIIPKFKSAEFMEF